MRREICGECGSPISDDGACDCTELLKRGRRLCAKGQRTTQWCAMAETLLREQRPRDEDIRRLQARVAELERFRAVVQTAMQIHVIDEDAIEWINQRLTFLRGEEGKQ